MSFPGHWRGRGGGVGTQEPPGLGTVCVLMGAVVCGCSSADEDESLWDSGVRIRPFCFLSPSFLDFLHPHTVPY